MSDKPDDEEDTSSWRPQGKQLRADGRMTGDLPKPAPPQPPRPPVAAPGPPSLEALTTAELELDRKAPRPAYVEPPAYRPVVLPSRSGAWKWVAALAVLAVATLGVFAYFPGLQHALPVPPPTRGTLLITSEPEGATVKIAGQVVGETPLARDNLWAGEVKYEVSAPGYKSRWGTFRGGETTSLNVKLTR